MTLSLAGLGTAVADHDYTQDQLLELARPCAGGAAGGGGRRLDALYRRSGVRRRQAGVGIEDFYRPPAETGAARGPTTAARMAVYARAIAPPAERAARGALGAAGIEPSAAAQLVTVSCTGYASPGLDTRLMQRLGLDAGAGRTQLGFMGCHGALSGLRVAGGLARAAPGRPVLLVCAELCTLHFRYGSDPQAAVANALFGDGAGACVVVADGGETGAPHLVDSGSHILAGAAEAMTWTIGDHGFEMTLSPRVPALVAEHLPGFLAPWLAGHGLAAADVGGWAIHPGGPRVIDAVETALDLPAGAGDRSRAVLADHGNMSSPTVLFILERMMVERVPRPWVALAFGPGLTIEAALVG